MKYGISGFVKFAVTKNILKDMLTQNKEIFCKSHPVIGKKRIQRGMKNLQKNIVKNILRRLLHRIDLIMPFTREELSVNLVKFVGQLRMFMHTILHMNLKTGITLNGFVMFAIS